MGSREPRHCSLCEELFRELAAEQKERERLNAEVVRLREALIQLSDLMESK